MADRRLQVFHAVAKHLSFTRAADALFMTQPAVTFQIKQLEEQYSTRLFERRHGSISLTPAGERARDGTIEAEANHLAGVLLLTDEGAAHVMFRRLLDEAQRIYGISEAMLNYRLRISGAMTRFQRASN